MTQTKRGKPLQSSEKKKTAHKKLGEPIDRNRSYTMAQLRDALSVSRMTLYRYMNKLGLKQFTTPLAGTPQITGEQYFAWLDWRRQQAAASE